MLDDPPSLLPRLDIGQVSVLVEDPGQLVDLLTQSEPGQPGPGAVEAASPPMLEEVVDPIAVRAAQVAEELGGEIAVPLGKQVLGRRR